MANFVLVPGACHGGWWFEPLAHRLREHGHTAYAVTLTGVGDRAHLLASSVNLDTHIQDVVGVLVSEQLEDVVLCGHSYAGMVVSAVADRCPERIDSLVYVDAFVPANGDSAWNLTTEDQRRWYIAGAGADGIGVQPMSFFDPRATPHPLASLIQQVRINDSTRRYRRRDYIYAAEFRDSPFTPTYDRLRDDPTWNVHALASGHNVMNGSIDELTRILLDVIATQ
ncbi:alpha/beta hydrolase [Nocardia sp. NPDC046763]|uniref:alpha/beta fold hydrolase n=1 Tax=Nocardia sp. NPDC046763 TaxID=3155256 RepID=UPI0033C6EAF5